MLMIMAQSNTHFLVCHHTYVIAMKPTHEPCQPLEYNIALKLPSSLALILNHEKPDRENAQIRESDRGLTNRKK
jgi:hypothetical protein